VSPWKTNRLRVLRAERRLTQHVVAKRLGISQAQYWKFESALIEPSLSDQRRIARVLGVSIDDLLPMERAS
jgi:transcriptional regulator with XRE-family HTH domain